jgi:hypothetical protein
MSSWWNDRGYIRLGHGSRAPVDCAQSRPSHRWEWVPRFEGPMAHCLTRGFHVSLGQGRSKLRGFDVFYNVTGAQARRKSRPSCPRPFRKARVRWGLSFVPQATDMMSALLVGQFY